MEFLICFDGMAILRKVGVMVKGCVRSIKSSNEQDEKWEVPLQFLYVLSGHGLQTLFPRTA